MKCSASHVAVAVRGMLEIVRVVLLHKGNMSMYVRRNVVSAAPQGFPCAPETNGAENKSLLQNQRILRLIEAIP